jgi:lysophospholipase L1-like esterase
VKRKIGTMALVVVGLLLLVVSATGFEAGIRSIVPKGHEVLVPKPARMDENGPLRILAVGDSISVGCMKTPLEGWCGNLDHMLTDRGIEHQIYGHAYGGWSCAALWENFPARFDEVQPNLVIINCGTNDGSSYAPDPVLGEKWRSMVEYSYVRGAKILPVLIQYSNPEINAKAGRGWLVPAEANVNDTIFFNMQYYINYGWFVGVADLQQVPGDWDFLNGGTDGIHPNKRGHKIYARLFYRAMKDHYQWPNNVSQPCGMWGHRAIYSPPPFKECS